MTIRPSEWVLRLPDGEDEVITTNSILSAEGSPGIVPSCTGRGALVGGIVGGGVGVLFWLVITADDDGPFATHIGRWLAIYGTGSGVALGTLVGSQVASDRWIPAAISGSTSVLIPHLDVGLSLRLQPARGR